MHNALLLRFAIISTSPPPAQLELDIRQASASIQILIRGRVYCITDQILGPPTIPLHPVAASSANSIICPAKSGPAGDVFFPTNPATTTTISKITIVWLLVTTTNTPISAFLLSSTSPTHVPLGFVISNEFPEAPHRSVCASKGRWCRRAPPSFCWRPSDGHPHSTCPAWLQ